MRAFYKKYILNFKQASGTSRGVLHTKETYFIIIENDGKIGIGETGLFRGLSIDDVPNYEAKLAWVCNHIYLDINELIDELKDFPSIIFGLEQAFLSFNSQHTFKLFPSNFTKGKDAIAINGLIWMGDKNFMQQQIKQKIEQGFSCIKMKIGAIDFDTEFELLQSIRKEFSPSDIELRVDANGAFHPTNALQKLVKLASLQLHSIEQPIKQNQLEVMAKLCEKTPLPIALDEELIGISSVKEKQKLLQVIQPQYIILKPSLVGGFQSCKEWIELATQNNCGWWITSALESNIGLNAIAQFTYTLQSNLPQGLGTGGLFTNNFECPLIVKNGYLHYEKDIKWNFNLTF